MRTRAAWGTIACCATATLLGIGNRAGLAADGAEKDPLVYSSPDADETPQGHVKFHGPFGRETLIVRAAGLPAHDFLDISFNLIVIRSWDGSVPVTSPDKKPQPLGPDYFRLGIHGGATLLYTTFSNVPADPGFRAESRLQQYPSQIPGDTFAGGTGSVDRNSLGYGYPDVGPGRFVAMDAMYRIHFIVPHATGDVALELSGINLQDLHDESWGVANVRVEGMRASEVSKPDAAAIAAAFSACQNAAERDLPGQFQTLISGMDDTVAWMEKNVKPAALSATTVTTLLAHLNSGDDQVELREKSYGEIVDQGHMIEPALRDARREAVGDHRLRIDWALATLGVTKVPEETRPALLATRVLEIIGTPRALALRKKLSQE